MTRPAITIALARILFVAALFSAIRGAAEVRKAPLEQEPAFRDNFYGVEIRGNLVWIVGYYGTILHSMDRGLTWELQKSGTRDALYRVVFVDERKGWASGSYGRIVHTKDGGRTWEAQRTPVEEHLFGLNFLDERLGWAVGGRGTVLATVDGGASWMNRPIGEDVILNDVWFRDRRQGWIVGEFGRIYHSRDGGKSWIKQQSPIEVSFASGESRNLFRLLVSSSDGRRTGAWAFGLDGVILEARDGGRWEIAHKNGVTNPAVTTNHLFAAASFKGRKWAVGERGTVIFAPEGNNHWKKAGLRVPPVSLNNVAFGRDGLGFIVGNRGAVLRTEDGGGVWKLLRIVPAAPGRGMGRSL